MSLSPNQVHDVDCYFNFNPTDKSFLDHNFNTCVEQDDYVSNTFPMSVYSSYAKDTYIQPSKNPYQTTDEAFPDSPGSTASCSQETIKEGTPLLNLNPGADTPDYSMFDLNSKENESDEDSDYEEKPTAKKSKAKGKANKAPRKKAEKSQNRMKNIPGLITQRVKTSITEMNAFGHHLISRFGTANVERVKVFLQGYEKQWKTWTSIEKFLKTDTIAGGLLLDFVMEFLCERSSEHFEQYVNSGKMNDKNRETVRNGKEFFLTKFSELGRKINGPSSPMRSEGGYSTRYSETGSFFANVTIECSPYGLDDFEGLDECYEPFIVKKTKGK